SRTAGPSLTHCQDCGDPIPEARRALGGMLRCTPCQSAFEKGGRR
ncbi:conjugal transfer protein TraR, partial [Pseudomonas aeruginosa]